MTDINGNIVNTYAYDPYGVTLSSSGTTGNKIQYQNAYLDGSTNLYKMGTRYYNPGEGRFTQVDPSGKDFYYSFTGDNPINYSDPTGLSECSDFVLDYAGGIVGIAGGLYSIATAETGIGIGIAVAGFGFGIASFHKATNTLQTNPSICI